jgi:Terminase small subunit.
MAGFGRNSTAARRLSENEDVRARVHELLDSAAERAGISRERVLKELARIAFADIRSLVEWRDEGTGLTKDAKTKVLPAGVRIRCSGDISDDIAAAISEVVPTSNGPRIKLHDKRAALIDLGKHLGLFDSSKADSGKSGAYPLMTISDTPEDGSQEMMPSISEQDWEQNHAGEG